MPLNSGAQFMSNDELARGLLEFDPSRLQLLRFLPFYKIRGNSLTYVRTAELQLAEAAGFCDPITEETKLPISPNVNFVMAEIASHFEVSYKGQDIFCETNDLFAVERDLAIRQMLYKYSRLFQDGDKTANPDEFDGLNKLVDPTKIIDKACTPLTIEDLDKAKGMVGTNQGYCGVIITNQTGYEFLRKAYYDVGTRPAQVMMDIACEDGGVEQQELTGFDGWAVLINDQQPDFTCGAPAAAAANFWFTIFGWNHLHGIIPDCGQDSMFLLRKSIRPDDSKDVGHLTLPAGLALGSHCALAAIKNAIEPVPSGGGGACCDASLLTVTDETAVAPNSRQLVKDFATSLEDGGAGGKLKISSHNPFRELAFVEHFFFYNNDRTLENRYRDTKTGSGITENFLPDPAGIIEFVTTTPTAANRCYLRTNSSTTGNAGPISTARNPHLLVLMRMTSGGTGTNPVIHVGMMNESPPTGVASPNPDSGCFFRKRSGDTNWIAVCRNNGVESTLDTGVAAADSVFRKLEMVVTGTTSVEVFVDGVSKGTIGSNIPTDTLGLIFGANTANEVESTPTIEIDAIAVEQDES